MVFQNAQAENVQVSNPAYDTVVIYGVELLRSTDKAGLYLVDDEYGKPGQHWIPFSQLREGSVDRDGSVGDIFIPRWLAEEKNLDYSDDID